MLYEFMKMEIAFHFLTFFIGIKLIHNIILVPAVQHSDSGIVFITKWLPR